MCSCFLNSRVLRTATVYLQQRYIVNNYKSSILNDKMPNPPIKKQKIHFQIGTHDGVFHCDEALACYMLKRLPQYTTAEIVRTRTNDKLSECDIVVDVGATFDASTHRYDHHQRDFAETLSTLRPNLGNQWNIKLSSAGLIYTYFGEQVIQEILNANCIKPLTDPDLKLIYTNVYKYFIQEIDAIDNGVQMFDGEPKYTISTDISSRVGRLNPNWNATHDVDASALFEKAMALVGEEFVNRVLYFASIWLPVRELVKKALKDRINVHPSGEIIEFTETFPWKEHLFNLETELSIENVIKYVIFMDNNAQWRMQCVPVQPKSFIARKSPPGEWLGLRDKSLSDKTGIPDCIFCHTTGFIAGNKTREGALAMAIKCLEA